MLQELSSVEVGCVNGGYDGFLSNTLNALWYVSSVAGGLMVLCGIACCIRPTVSEEPTGDYHIDGSTISQGFTNSRKPARVLACAIIWLGLSIGGMGIGGFLIG